ncbi:hypothetical protein Q8G40_29690, partial [Klebsiella pneumoniae]|uniref:hypothetical protein n=1 Tax=Klebsiella pneumoniae TaxID=573 RepID=UPI003014009A
MLILDIPRKDIIIGMDWLQKNNVQIDCAKRVLKFKSGETYSLAESKLNHANVIEGYIELLDSIPVITE